MRYLVEVVWTSRSALRAGSDLYNLVFVRWERQRDWSPWNCILLSKEETSAHLEVEDVHKVCLRPTVTHHNMSFPRCNRSSCSYWLMEAKIHSVSTVI